MTAGKYDFTIEQGARFTRVFTVKDENDALVNLTGFTARLQIRKNIEDANPLVSLTSAGGDITLGGSAGTVTVAIPATTTAGYSWTGQAFYDLELLPAASEANAYRLLNGRVLLSSEVTR